MGPMVDTAPTDVASATAASGSVRLRLSPRLMPRLMPVFSTEAMAMADLPPMPTAATGPTAPTPMVDTAPTDTALATAVSATTAGNSLSPSPPSYVREGHHLHACCAGE